MSFKAANLYTLAEIRGKYLLCFLNIATVVSGPANLDATHFSGVESSSPSALHLLSSSSHHFECLSVVACSFVSGWLQLQDVLYGQCF